jgi:hypothetical protein
MNGDWAGLAEGASQSSFATTDWDAEPALQQAKHWSPNLPKYLLSFRLVCNDMKADIHQ